MEPAVVQLATAERSVDDDGGGFDYSRCDSDSDDGIDVDYSYCSDADGGGFSDGCGDLGDDAWFAACLY